MSRIAAQYAKALLQVAKKQGILADTHADMQRFEQACVAYPPFVAILKSPVIQHDKKLLILNKLFQDSVHTVTLNFFALVTERHREALLFAIAQAFLAQYEQHQGIQKAQVTTPYPLSDAVVAQMKQIVQQIVPCQQVILDQHVDDSLIGGFVLQVANQQLDRSLRRALKTLKQHYTIEAY